MNEGIERLEEIIRQLKLIHTELEMQQAHFVRFIPKDPARENQEQPKLSGKFEYLVEWLRENDQPELSTRKMAELIPFPVSHVLVGKARRELHATDV